MPYASNKQAAFMHIHHPEIAQRWHDEGHGYVKGNKKKKKKDVEKRLTPLTDPFGVSKARYEYNTDPKKTKGVRNAMTREAVLAGTGVGGAVVGGLSRSARRSRLGLGVAAGALGAGLINEAHSRKKGYLVKKNLNVSAFGVDHGD